MNTIETAKITTTPYFVEYVCRQKEGQGLETYYQLVRTADVAILYANESLDNVYLHCFFEGINIKEISLW